MLQMLKVVAQAAIAYGGTGFAVIADFSKTQPDPAGVGEIRSQRHIKQSSLAAGPDRRDAGYRGRKTFPLPPALQFAGTQGYQYSPIIGEKGQRPRMGELILQNLNTHLPGESHDGKQQGGEHQRNGDLAHGIFLSSAIFSAMR